MPTPPQDSISPTIRPSDGTGATASASPSQSAPSSSAPISAEPPAASLSAEGGDRVVGQLGSYTWGDMGSDSPWLPGSPIRLGSGEPLAVALAGDVAIAGWSARRVPAGTTDGSGAVGLGSGPGPGPIAFHAPGVGTWSLQVTVQFADGLGDAAYYWTIEVR
jgi:hypothetical protein